MVIFKSKQKKFEGDFKTRLCAKMLYLKESVQYPGVKIDTKLSWKCQVIDDLSIEMTRTYVFLKNNKKIC